MPWHILRVLVTLYSKMAQEWNNKILLSHACLLSNLSAKNMYRTAKYRFFKLAGE